MYGVWLVTGRKKFELLLLPRELLLKVSCLAGKQRDLGLDCLEGRSEFLKPLFHRFEVRLRRANVLIHVEQLPAQVA